MSLRSWISLLLFYAIYLLIGGFTFQVIEWGSRDRILGDRNRRSKELPNFQEIKSLILKNWDRKGPRGPRAGVGNFFNQRATSHIFFTEAGRIIFVHPKTISFLFGSIAKTVWQSKFFWQWSTHTCKISYLFNRKAKII
jgi:hypothetical protein